MELEDFKAPVKLKLSALWASLMFLYIYADFFGLFVPGRLAGMNAGMMQPLGRATDAVLLGTSVMMIVPSLMVAAAILLPPRASRWASLVLGPAYASIILLTMVGAPPFYLLFGAIEVAIGMAIAWLAWTWPRGGGGA